jgi:hypothetical protein
MNPAVAVKLAEHLSKISASARIKRALDENKDINPYLLGGGGGALAGALLGGGSTAVANMFRKKQDRKSVLNNALMGGIGGGALGLGGTAIYKGLESKLPEEKEISPKEQAALDFGDDPIKATTGISTNDVKTLGSIAGGTFGYVKGNQSDYRRLLENGYMNNRIFKDKVDRLTGGNDTVRDTLFRAVARNRGQVAYDMYPTSTQVRVPVPPSVRPSGGGPPVRGHISLTPDMMNQQIRELRAANVAKPVSGRLKGTVTGLAAPWLVPQLLSWTFGVDPRNNPNYAAADEKRRYNQEIEKMQQP